MPGKIGRADSKPFHIAGDDLEDSPLLGAHAGPAPCVSDVIVSEEVKDAMEEELRNDPIGGGSARASPAKHRLEAYDHIPEEVIGYLCEATLPHRKRENISRAITPAPQAVEIADDRIIHPEHAQFRVRTSRGA